MAQPAPPISFSTFVISLASSGMADAAAGGDRELARQTLDLLAVLADKTRGNLDEEEARLLEAVRAELRTRIG